MIPVIRPAIALFMGSSNKAGFSAQVWLIRAAAVNSCRMGYPGGRRTVHHEEQRPLEPPDCPAGVGQTRELAELRVCLPVFGGELFLLDSAWSMGGIIAYSVAEGSEEPPGSGGLKGVDRHD